MERKNSGYDPAHRIHDAAHAGDVDSLVRLLDANPERVGEWGPRRMQPLHFARDAAVAETLLRYGAVVDARTRRDETPLYFAARNGHRDVAEVLLRHGADLHAVEHRGETPLYIAAHTPSPGGDEVARFLLDRGAELDLSSALALRMLDRARRLLDDPGGVRNAPRPEFLPRLAVWVVLQAIMEKVGETEYVMMYRSGEYELDPDRIAAVVAEHTDILEKILAHGVPMSRWTFEALGTAVELPHTAVAELLLKVGTGAPEWAPCDYGWLDRRVECSACKDAMRALLHRYGIDWCGQPRV
jgi:hypothetical protein